VVTSNPVDTAPDGAGVGLGLGLGLGLGVGSKALGLSLSLQADNRPAADTSETTAIDRNAGDFSNIRNSLF